MSCRTVRDWLHRDAEDLTEADRLVLEDHLEACEVCRHARGQLVRVRDLAREMPLEPLGTHVHQRAIARAMLGGTAPIARRRWQAAHLAVVGGALCAATLAALWLVRGNDDAASAPPAPRPEPVAISPAAPASSVAGGQLLGDGIVLAVGSEVPDDAALHTEDGARLVLPAAEVELAADTTIRWARAQHALLLDHGRIDVQADPRAATRLRVVTKKFTVEVTGTIFHVTTREVSVARGSVRVLGADGTLLVASLTAGESWSLPAERPPLASGSALAPPPTTPPIRAETWLARARKAFTAGDCTSAEHHADAALDAGPTRGQAAEARTTLAECAQASGRVDEAVRRYEAIASRFADLPAGATALIASARLEDARGNARAARAMFRRYLTQYPDGPFADDARRYLTP